MAEMDEELTLWLANRLCAAEGSASREVFVADVAERVEEGASLAEAMNAVTKHDPRAGDFGMEVVGSFVTVAILEGLRNFWEAYAKELEQKAGKSLADMTVDFVKSRFKADAAVAEDEVATRVADAIVAAGARVNVKPADLKRTLDAVPSAILSPHA